MSAVIEARQIVRKFGEVTALRGLSLQVEAGQIYGLVGPDGAGKTCAMRILAGVMGPSEGQARVLDRDPLTGGATVRSTIGYMPQHYSLYGDLSIDENLRFFARMFCIDRATYEARRQRLLGITRLERFSDRRADALSGGMYKKLALSCALLPEPAALILDEPTNGVDPVSRRELWSLLFEFVAEGMAIIVSTAYMDEAARCHRVGLLDQGRLLLEGSASELLSGFEHPTFTVTFSDPSASSIAIDYLDQAWEVLARSVSSNIRIVVRAGEEAKVRAHLAQLGGQLAPASPDFEDLFLATAKVHA